MTMIKVAMMRVMTTKARLELMKEDDGTIMGMKMMRVRRRQKEMEIIGMRR